jgi:phospholipase/lecithinase/hemolysin
MKSGLGNKPATTTQNPANYGLVNKPATKKPASPVQAKTTNAVKPVTASIGGWGDQ